MMKNAKLSFIFLAVVVFISITTINSKRHRRLPDGDNKTRRMAVLIQPVVAVPKQQVGIQGPQLRVTKLPAQVKLQPVKLVAPAIVKVQAPVAVPQPQVATAATVQPPVAAIPVAAPPQVVVSSTVQPVPATNQARAIATDPATILPTGFYTVPLYGSDNLKYYFADLWVGVPAQKQSVIVDTGSDYLAFPCSYCAEGNCGKHNNPVLDMKKNTTGKPMSCLGSFENFKCAAHCYQNQCGFSRKYLEGSSLQGIVFQDYIGVVAPEKVQSGNSTTKLIRSKKQDVAKFPKALGLYGCTTKETGLFRTQLANGIMGLGDDTNTIKTSPNFIDSLFKSRQSNNRNFSMCLGTNGGYLTFGGYNVKKHIKGEGIQTITYTKNYIVDVKNVSVNADNNKSLLKPMTAMLDSGTTYTYLRGDAFELMATQFNNYCKQKSSNQFDLCGKNLFFKKGYCATFDQNHYKTLENFFNSFPKLYFKLGVNTTIIWFAKDYLTKSDTSTATQEVFCSSVHPTPPGIANSTLGSSFFRHYDIYFDRDHKNISFVRSECDDKSPRSYPILGIRGLIRSARVLLSSIGGSYITWGIILGMFFLLILKLIHSLKIKNNSTHDKKVNSNLNQN